MLARSEVFPGEDNEKSSEQMVHEFAMTFLGICIMVQCDQIRQTKMCTQNGHICNIVKGYIEDLQPIVFAMIVLSKAKAHCKLLFKVLTGINIRTFT